MAARHFTYWDYDRGAALTCSACGWLSRGEGNEEHLAELLDVTCPNCQSMLLVVPFPTEQETRAAASRGDERAKREIPHLDARNARLEAFDQGRLRDADQLPELSGPRVLIEWDLEEIGDERWTILRYEGTELWRELALWEGIDRFIDVFGIIQDRYGARLDGVRPTDAAARYLFGDDLGASREVDLLNESLRRQPLP